MTGDDRSIHIWAGWGYLFNGDRLIEQPETTPELICIDSLAKPQQQLLEQLREISPKLFSTPTRSLSVDDEVIPQCLQCIDTTVEKDQSFLFKYRLLKIIDAGNRLGYFKIRLKSLPVPLPHRPASPFTQSRFALLPKKNHLLRWYRTSLEQPPPENDYRAHAGCLYLSAMFYGGLIKTGHLSLLLDAVEQQGVKGQSLDLITGQVLVRRWYPDPLSHLLLLRWQEQRQAGHPQSTTGSAYSENRSDVGLRKIYPCIKHYLKCCSMRVHEIPSLTALVEMARLHLQLSLPPYLVEFAHGKTQNSAASVSVWQRFSQPDDFFRFVDKPVGSEPTKSDQEDLSSRHAEDNADLVEGAIQQEDWPEALRELSSLILTAHRQKMTNTALKKVVSNWRSNTSPEQIPSVVLMADWVTDWLLTTTHGKKAVSASRRTLYTYFNAIAGRICSLLGAQDITEWGEAEAFIELYTTVIDDTPSLAVRKRVSMLLDGFHQYLTKHYAHIPTLDNESLFIVRGKGYGVVDANLLCVHSFEKAKHYLRLDSHNREDHDLAEMLCCIADLGFYAGLRRSEVLGLSLSDIEITGNHIDIVVQPNALRRLKTKSAHRVLPLSDLAPRAVCDALLHYMQSRSEQVLGDHSKHISKILLFDPGNENDSLLHNKKIEKITEALRYASGDPSIRFHHLRHSFANWQLLKFWAAEHDGPLSDLGSWVSDVALNHERLVAAKAESQRLIGTSTTHRRSVMQISRLLGHSSTSITMGYYVHMLDVILGASVRRLAPALSTKALKALTGYQDSHIKRIKNTVGTDELSSLAIKQGTGHFDDFARKELQESGYRRDILLGCLQRRLKKQVGLENGITGTTNPFQAKGDWVYANPDNLEGLLRWIAILIDRLQSESEQDRSKLAHQFMLTDTQIDTLRHRIRTMPTGIFIEAGGYQIDQYKQGRETFPKGKKQRDIVKVILRTINLALERASPCTEAIEIFVQGWQPQSHFSVQVETIKQAKHWILFLHTLGITSDALVLTHIPNRQSRDKSLDTQRQYWCDQLRRYFKYEFQLGQEPNETQTLAKTRGGLKIEIDISKLVGKMGEHKKITNFYGFRLILAVAYLFDYPKKSYRDRFLFSACCATEVTGTDQ